MAVFKTLDSVVNRIMRILCLGCMIGLFVILIFNVLFRWVPILSYIPSFSMGWFDEIVEMMFAWMVMSASTLLCRNKNHFKVDLIQMKIEGKRSYYILEFLINLATMVFFAALLYYSWVWASGATQTTPVLKMRRTYPYMCIPVNAFLMLCYTVRDAVVNLQHAVSPKSL